MSLTGAAKDEMQAICQADDRCGDREKAEAGAAEVEVAEVEAGADAAASDAVVSDIAVSNVAEDNAAEDNAAEAANLDDYTWESDEAKESGADTGMADAGGLFRGIQFDKNIFRNISPDQQQRFQKTFGHRLKKLERILKGGRRAAGNDFKLVRGCKGRKVLKRRVGSNRLSMVFKDGILTLLKLSSHDRQMVDIRKSKGRSVGYVYYELEDFLQQLAEWQPKNQGRQSFGEYMASPRHFVYDSDQQSIIESGEKG